MVRSRTRLATTKGPPPFWTPSSYAKHSSESSEACTLYLATTPRTHRHSTRGALANPPPRGHHQSVPTLECVTDNQARSSHSHSQSAGASSRGSSIEQFLPNQPSANHHLPSHHTDSRPLLQPLTPGSRPRPCLLHPQTAHSLRHERALPQLPQQPKQRLLPRSEPPSLHACTSSSLQLENKVRKQQPDGSCIL